MNVRQVNLIFVIIFAQIVTVFGITGMTDCVTTDLKWTDNIPKEHISDEKDAYLKGYIRALINFYYYEFDVSVYVGNRHVYLYNLPKNDLIKNSIVNSVKDLPEVTSVTSVDQCPMQRSEKVEKKKIRTQIKGMWFPQQILLYPPMIANPRATAYSATYRIGDNIMKTKSIAVSLGDDFPIFRWRNIFSWKGDMQIDIQAGVWSVFKIGVHYDQEMSELINTDYLIGLPLSYAFDKWAFRFRIYHISSHLGDEFMDHNSGFKRLNPSMEAIDLFGAYQINMNFRVYGGFGLVCHSDKTYYIKSPLYVEWGGEARVFGEKIFRSRLYGTPFLAIYFRNWQVNNWIFDSTCMLGYEMSKFQGVGRKVRIFINYHHGYSEGQFFKDRTSFTGCGLSWGF